MKQAGKMTTDNIPSPGPGTQPSPKSSSIKRAMFAGVRHRPERKPPVVEIPDPIGPQNDFPSGPKCKYIYGEPTGAWRTCAHPSVGSYCDAHRKILFQAIDKKMNPGVA
jgi:hypothetical protein